MDRSINWKNKKPDDFLFDSDMSRTCAATVSSCSDGNNLTNQTRDSQNCFDCRACLPHNVYKSSSSCNNNKASCSSSNSCVGPTNPRSISESPATNLSFRNVLAPEPSRNHYSCSRAGQSYLFPLLPHEMMTSHNRQRLAMDAPADEGLDFFHNDHFESENKFVEFRDPHKDMRLDVDNMSYEELLALEERIGNVSCGLNKSYIRGSIKQRKYRANRASQNLEPCSICWEDYVDGVNVGKLDCDHEFHTDCIQHWLTLKNNCPICKMTAIET